MGLLDCLNGTGLYGIDAEEEASVIAEGGGVWLLRDCSCI